MGTDIYPSIDIGSMRDVFRRIPLPISGVALAFASLGTLLSSWSEAAYWVCGILSASIISLLSIKLALFPDLFREDLKNPIPASVSGTFPMALMVLSTYVSGILYEFALALWSFAILLHISLMIYFTRTFILRPDIQKVFASYFIVYVGIVVASVTCPTYDMHLIGSIIFWFGFIALIPLMVLISYRYIKYGRFPEPTSPLLCIYCAPVSLCIVGYMRSMTQISETFVIAMYVVSVLLYLFGLVVVARTLMLRFYPSYAALTFPMVICATATTSVSRMLSGYQFLEVLALIETVLAVTVVSYVLLRYVMAIARPTKV